MFNKYYEAQRPFERPMNEIKELAQFQPFGKDYYNCLYLFLETKTR